MFPLYLFSLVLGGGFLAASLLGGVVGGHLDSDLASGHELYPALEADHEAAARIFSVRALVYGLFGFGAVGAVLTMLRGGPVLTAVAAVAAGVLSAGTAVALFRWIRSGEQPDREGDASWVGLPGRVTLPIRAGSPGTIAVIRGERRVALRALPHGSPGGDPEDWSTVVIVDMEGGVARVAPTEDLGPES